MPTNEIDITLRATDHASAVIKGAANSTMNLSQASQLLGNAANQLQQIYAAYNQVIDATVAKTAAYSEEVSNLARISGQSVPETSRVIQVMDDLGVSTTQLEMATKKLSAEGLSLNIATLADLSDEYNKLAPGADRAAFLTDKFGRSGLDMARAMEQGGEALRQKAQDHSGSLILTQQQADAYEAWRLSVDAAEDATAGIAAAIGNALTPAVTEFNNKWAEGLEGWAKFISGADNAIQVETRMKEILNEQGLALEKSARNGKVRAKATDEQIAAAREQAIAEQTATEAVQQNTAAAEDNAEAIAAQEKAIADMTARNQEYLAFIDQVASAEQANTDAMASLTDKRSEAQAKYNMLYEQGYRNTQKGTMLGNALEEIQNLDAQITETAANYEQQIDRMIAADLLKGLSSGGLTDAETAYYQKIQLSMGLITQQQIDDAARVKAEVDALLAAAPGGAGVVAPPAQASAIAQEGAEGTAVPVTQSTEEVKKYAQVYDGSAKDISADSDVLVTKYGEAKTALEEMTVSGITNIELFGAAIHKSFGIDAPNEVRKTIMEVDRLIKQLLSISSMQPIKIDFVVSGSQGGYWAGAGIR